MSSGESTSKTPRKKTARVTKGRELVWLSLRVDRELYELLCSAADASDRSIAGFIRHAVKIAVGGTHV